MAYDENNNYGHPSSIEQTKGYTSNQNASKKANKKSKQNRQKNNTNPQMPDSDVF